MGGGIAGEASLRNRVDGPTSAVMNIYVHRPTDATQQRRLGTNIFHGEQYWQGFVSLYRNE